MVALRKSEFAGTTAGEVQVPPRDEIAAHYLSDETRLVGGLVERAVFTDEERRRVSEIARTLVTAARAGVANHGGIDAFMREYGLSSEEGIILMCLAEALLRIPDSETADRFIAEKIAGGQWERHRGHSDSTLVNASTWALMLTGRLVKLREARGSNPWEALKRLAARSGEPVIRQAVRQAVKVLGDQFVLGRSIRDALSRSAPYEARGFRFSYDMLGEAAKTAKDAERYFERYMGAIEAVGEAAGPNPLSHPDALIARPGLSVKLSALHARYEPGKEARLSDELYPRLLALLRAAEARGLAVTIDAEEQDRHELMLDLFARAYTDPALERWTGLGLAVQAYGKRAIPTIRWLRRLSEAGGKRIPLRLVKGAYWDSEIKWAQERGLADYPVFTRKLHTDVSYLACMRLVLSDSKAFYPQFATHNAHTVAAAVVAAGQTAFEFQRLHGMGEALYEEVSAPGKLIHPCRIYAPVGEHEDLLSYLVRRLLENGANTSFVNRLADDEAPIAQIIRDPVEIAERERQDPGTAKPLPRPRDIYWPERKNSFGVALTDRTARRALVADMEAALVHPFDAGPIVDGVETIGGPQAALLTCPHDRRERLGSVRIATPRDVDTALASAERAAHGWNKLGGPQRAKILDLAADMIERDRARLMAVLVREAGKTLPAALAEVREAADLLRYYAVEARRLMSVPVSLKGPTGESNTLDLHGRGPFACIAPWNFPLAIFVGQIAAALAAGNPVLAKPAEQTPITAMLAVRILHEAGVPRDVLHLLTGSGAVGAALVKSPKIKGVAFTGGNDTAWAIQKALSERRGDIVPFIAETGGLNAMIADSSALPEQVVRDAVRSAFDSAGQRCSALRVIFVQEEIATRTLRMLTGAIEALDVGDPFDYATDVGPVIDEAAQDTLEAHKVRMQRDGRELIDLRLPNDCRAGTYVTPACYEIERMGLLEREVFGPILHVVRFAGGHLPKVVEAINATGYGLTLGLHSRIGNVADYVAEHARVGNLYVNRNQIGAVPGVQPFGGEGLSGTGPKAGGPNYLVRFAAERVRTTDITATGGNVGLLTDGVASSD
ncbi:MAG: bifunctional proline dehydrogenase/L-glutamate gamma-semialdehyde dehydrogenase PutA [Hyphomicrobium zavarzinii]|uniref:bifunctional proline dehydrogenase/L-glutamate gamma-semialdehyde dehydrogenase PutA n=1 Tax=Hyphomicrobium zavarzinii TaxID=48292 RepID=UPI001A426243|nr:bifunctional proline dehydrogenase/L-glutamate gamma-semialdehyde dehydrogenase PutA [Hyphomicrobium zavarzinii]MBL8847306.1 bifunctional proline dehydrogenase/L-glutamate gamma-semialdehyde dehydrogenase PutA [Hyphomicrobium zavarzinii]